jgi:KDEL-tailed cysteine endopeptidase
VRSQGDCGACWAITAVETVESAHYLATGILYDLSEAEVITCEESCEMCNGGWPQNAFEYTMDHGGLRLYNAFSYDASSLLAMTEGIEGTSNYWT